MLIEVSKHQQQGTISAMRMVWERGLVVRPMDTRTSSDWEDTEHKQEHRMSQNTQDGGGKDPKAWISAVAVDESLTGAPGKYAASGNGMAHLCFDPEGEPMYGEYGTVSAT